MINGAKAVSPSSRARAQHATFLKSSTLLARL